MGIYYKIINPVKSQFLDPFDFGEGMKWFGLLHGNYCVETLKFLLSDSHRPSGTALWDIEGLWVGDPVIISGDDSSPPNPVGIITATDDDPARNLNARAAAEFYNISHIAIAMLAENGYAEDIIKDAEQKDLLFLTIANLLMQVQPPKLQWAFDQRFGRNWAKRYNEIVKRKGTRALPIVSNQE